MNYLRGVLSLISTYLHAKLLVKLQSLVRILFNYTNKFVGGTKEFVQVWICISKYCISEASLYEVIRVNQRKKSLSVEFSLSLQNEIINRFDLINNLPYFLQNRWWSSLNIFSLDIIRTCVLISSTLLQIGHIWKMM